MLTGVRGIRSGRIRDAHRREIRTTSALAVIFRPALCITLGVGGSGLWIARSTVLVAQFRIVIGDQAQFGLGLVESLIGASGATECEQEFLDLWRIRFDGWWDRRFG